MFLEFKGAKKQYGGEKRRFRRSTMWTFRLKKERSAFFSVRPDRAEARC